MTESLTLELKPSKIYLMLSLSIHLLLIFCTWYYFHNIWLSIGISIVLVSHLYYFSRKILLLNNNSTKKITINNNSIVVENNQNKSNKYPHFYCEYQSTLLVIISAGKESVIIFKDSLENQSLSGLNRILGKNTKC